MRWKKAHRKHRVRALDWFFSDLSFQQERRLIPATPFTLAQATAFLSHLGLSSPVTFHKVGKTLAYYEPDTNEIYLSPTLAEPEKWRSVIHEAVHSARCQRDLHDIPHHNADFVREVRQTITTWEEWLTTVTA